MTIQLTRAVAFGRAPTSREALVRMGAGGVVVTLVGLVLGLAVESVSPLPVEADVLAAVNEVRTPAATTFFTWASFLGHLWVMALAVVVLTPVARFVTGGWQAAALLWAALVGALLITGVIKVGVGRERPLDALADATSAAFPSGHTSRSAAVLGLAMWAVAALARSPAVRAGLIALLGLGIAAVAVSRIYLGVHWPTDVAYGLVVGIAWLVVLLGAVRPRVGPTDPAPPGDPPEPDPSEPDPA